MESLDAPEVAAWVQAQNAVTSTTSRSCRCATRFKARITQLWDYPKTYVPALESGHALLSPEQRAAEQSPLYVRTGLDGRARSCSLDPERLVGGRIAVARRIRAVAGREAAGLHPVRRRRRLADGAGARRSHRQGSSPTRCKWMRFSGLSWTKDGKGFFYSRYPEPPKGKVLEAALVRPGALLPPRRHAAVAGRRWSTSARTCRRGSSAAA